MSLSDALHDPELNALLDQEPRHLSGPLQFTYRERDYARQADAAHDLAPPQPPRSRSPTHAGHVPRADEPNYYATDFGPSSPRQDCDIPSTTLLSDSEAADPGAEDVSSQAVLDFRSRRTRQMNARPNQYQYPEGPSAQSAQSEERWRAGIRGLYFEANRERENENWLAQMERRTASPASAARSEEGVHGGPPKSYAEEIAARHQDDRVTCAHFGIQEGKHKVAIKFEPAVSGRYVLVKLWAHGAYVRGAGNVDVQSVIAKGFGGPRYFPRRVLR